MDFRQRPVTVRISTHTLARRVTFTLLSSPQQHHHFNPHPRTEGDACGDAVRRRDWISTHTLARRVTGCNPNWWPQAIISTHTLARRVTAKAHKKAACFCSEVIVLRKN